MTLKDRAFIKELLIKLDISIEAEHENASSQGLMLIFDFTAEKRKADMLKALNILSEDLPQYGKFKNADELYKAYLELEKAYTRSQKKLKADIPDELYIMPARANGKPTATVIKIKEAMNKVAINELTDLKDKIINGTYPLASIDSYGDRVIDNNDLINIIDEKIKKLVEVKL